MVNTLKVLLGLAFGAAGVIITMYSRVSIINKWLFIIPGLAMIIVGLAVLFPIGLSEKTGGK